MARSRWLGEEQSNQPTINAFSRNTFKHKTPCGSSFSWAKGSALGFKSLLWISLQYNSFFGTHRLAAASGREVCSIAVGYTENFCSDFPSALSIWSIPGSAGALLMSVLPLCLMTLWMLCTGWKVIACSVVSPWLRTYAINLLFLVTIFWNFAGSVSLLSLGDMWQYCSIRRLSAFFPRTSLCWVLERIYTCSFNQNCLKP